jgi:tRNA uridine 5-carboxymethylaminomethyl modification enzyme
VTAAMLLTCDPDLQAASPEVVGQAELSIKYDGYIRRQEEEANKLKKYEGMVFPPGFPFETVRGLSAEVRDKLARVRPASLGQAQRIPGMTPAAVALLLVHLKRLGRSPSPADSRDESAG